MIFKLLMRELYYNSFLPSTVRAWNNVNDEAKQSNSVNTFKCFLNKDKTRIPKHFYVGSRKAQVLHTRLRTNCSSLNLDLFLKNISDSPLCRCGSVYRECPTLFFSLQVYLDPNEMSGRSYFCTCPQTILLSEKENRICTLFTHR